MKILHVLDHSIPLHSGYSFRTRAILKEQQKLGWETYQVTSPKHYSNTENIEEVDGLTFYRSNRLPGILSKLPLISHYAIVKLLEKRLNEIIPQIKPDLLHAHSSALNGLAALYAAKKFKLPLVYECRAFWEDAAANHGTTSQGSLRYKMTRALETYIFKNADAVTTICEGLRNDMIERGIPGEKITIIPNAVDILKFSFENEADQELIEKLNLQNKIILGYIGSFYAYEGVNLLIEALPILLKNRSDIRLLLVGGGPQEEAIKSKVNELGLQDKIILTGRVSHEQVQKYYDLVDIFVYPRLPMRLTDLVTPLKPLEAMAQGKLIVASDVGGHQELIRDGVNGFFFKAGDASDLSNTVLEVLNNRSTWHTISKEARNYVEQERNWTVSVQNYQEVYGKLTGNQQK